MEEELEIKWKFKMADALSAANKEKDRLVGEVREEKEVIKSQALKLKEKVTNSLVVISEFKLKYF